MQNILQGLMLRVTKRGTRSEVGEGVLRVMKVMMVVMVKMVLRR